MENKRQQIILPVLVAFCTFCLNALLLKWLWNSCLVSVIHVSEIGYWQSVGILMLVGIFAGRDFKVKLNTNKDEQTK
jgi:hypothetical protein